MNELNGFYRNAVVPRIVTSQLHSANKGAVDWGWHGLLAYGSQHYVIIIDTKNVQQVQCLFKQKVAASIKKILWSPIREENDNLNLSLVTADVAGCLVYWNIKEAKVISSVQEGSKPVLAIEWVPRTNKDDHLYLAALHSPYSLVIWNMDKGWKEWKKSFTDILTSFNFDPFDGSKLAFLCPDCILFVDEFSVGKIPSTNGRKFYISSPRLPEENMRTRDRLKKLMRGMVVGENKPKPEDTMTISDCLQLVYHRALRNHVILLYARDILLIDLHINMTVGVVSIDKSSSPLLQIISCKQRDVLYCLHESGTVSVRVRRRSNSTFLMASPFDTPLDACGKLDNLTSSSSEKFVWYDYRCQSEPVRQVKGMKIVGIASCPVTEKEVGLVLNTGKIIFLEVEKHGRNSEQDLYKHYLLSSVLPPSTTDKLTCPLNMQIITSKMLNNYMWPVTAIKKCPTDSIRSLAAAASEHINYLAVGTHGGHILFYNVLTGSICKEFAVHNNFVRGIEWHGVTNIISWSYMEVSQHKVKNELVVTNVISGQFQAIRLNAGVESPIEFIRVSPLRQYFVIVKKDGKLELWNLKKLSFIRSMPDKFPVVKALEWSPAYSPKSRRKSVDKDSVNDTPFSQREHLVFCDGDCMLYHFCVNNNSLQDGIKIPPENLISPVTSLAFKSNKIVQADIEGQLIIWDLKEQVSRMVNTNRTCILKIRFSPGKGNLKLLILFIDGGVDIYDLKQGNSERISQLKCPRDIVKILDIDWATSYAPVLITEDGCILITDIHLKLFFSPLLDMQFENSVKCPALIPCHLISIVHAWFSMQETESSRNILFLSQIFDKEMKRQIDSCLTGELNNLSFGVTGRCLLMSTYLCLVEDIKFWTVVSYYLQAAVLRLENEHEIEETNDNKFTNKYFTLQPLDTSFDFLCDRYTFQKMQLEQVELHEWKRGDYQHTQRVIERLILLGEMDRAVQLLLETDFNNPNYYADAIKACLLAAIQKDTGSAQSTIKLVATNFIANGRIWEGVQLLCLTGKGADACRYLLSYGLCDAALWLAKATLTFDESLDIIKKCSAHYKNQGDWMNAVLILVSVFQWELAIELLLENKQYEKSALLLSSCRSFNVPINNELSIQTEDKFVTLLEK